MDLDPRLAALRPLGGFFVLRTTANTGAAPAGPLPALAQAYADTASDPRLNALAARVGAVAHRLRTPEPRVSASIVHQGLAARLWSAALGCAALYGRLPDLDPALLLWDFAATAPDDLWLTEVRPHPRDPYPTDAGTLADAVLHGHLEPLAKALRTRYGVATGLLWGNAGSALAGAARLLDRWARVNGRTDVADRTLTLTAALLTHPLLSTTGTLTGTGFRRRSCCLYYRVPGGGVCGDCCFPRPPALPRGPHLGDHGGPAM
ncbi:(2Fe-2S)-binding protein [Streptomyces sp. NPDC004542]|uniref:(2Fe-2S)-binding protein n=1 Tax=Streptomyces sp. NPDC004542 TaxID=3154281 RepID=UPI0033BBD397